VAIYSRSAARSWTIGRGSARRRRPTTCGRSGRLGENRAARQLCRPGATERLVKTPGFFFVTEREFKSGGRDLERGRLNFSAVEPGSDRVHSIAELISSGRFETNNQIFRRHRALIASLRREHTRSLCRRRSPRMYDSEHVAQEQGERRVGIPPSPRLS
jgi:hypothetical protein